MLDAWRRSNIKIIVGLTLGLQQIVIWVSAGGVDVLPFGVGAADGEHHGFDWWCLYQCRLRLGTSARQVVHHFRSFLLRTILSTTNENSKKQKNKKRKYKMYVHKIYRR